jgi:cobalt-zinc-cadmium resistance protein CzcA
VSERIKELNGAPGRLLPGVRIEPYYERPEVSEAAAVLWVRGAFPVGSALEDVSREVGRVRTLLLRHAEVREVVSQIGRDEGHAASAGYGRVRLFVRLGPAPRDEPRTARELAAKLNREAVGLGWGASAEFRDEMQEVFTAGPGEVLLKVRGPKLEELERLAGEASRELGNREGISGVRVTHVLGRPSLAIQVDREKCKRWGVAVADVQRVIQSTTGCLPVITLRERDMTTEVALCRPGGMRANEEAVLDIPVDVPVDRQQAPTAPRLRLRDLVSPVGADGEPEPKGAFLRQAAAAIYREEGRRLITVAFRLRDNDAASTLGTARRELAPLFQAPYRAEWEANLR